MTALRDIVQRLLLLSLVRLARSALLLLHLGIAITPAIAVVVTVAIGLLGQLDRSMLGSAMAKTRRGIGSCASRSEKRNSGGTNGTWSRKLRRVLRNGKKLVRVPGDERVEDEVNEVPGYEEATVVSG